MLLTEHTHFAVVLRTLFYNVSQAEFLNSKTDIGVYDVFSSPSETYLQVKTKSQEVKVQSETKLAKIGKKSSSYSSRFHIHHYQSYSFSRLGNLLS